MVPFNQIIATLAIIPFWIFVSSCFFWLPTVMESREGQLQAYIKSKTIFVKKNLAPILGIGARPSLLGCMACYLSTGNDLTLAGQAIT